MKPCPLCAEQIQDEAIKCRFCGGTLVSGFARDAAGVWAPPPPQQNQTSAMAVASLILGIVWLYWVGSILALIFGYLAKREIDQEPGKLTGRGMAITGIILGWVGVFTLAGTLALVIIISLRH